jgi:hypothetical protein
VLFSQDRVAQFINDKFEPVWEMVRPVPTIRIDFGDGNVVTRTLHGNILTSVCDAQGNLLDALPGIYTEGAYVDQLDQLRLLHSNYVQQGGPDARAVWLQTWHKKQALALAQGQPAERFNEMKRIAPVGKAVLEIRTEKLLAGPPGVGQPPNGLPLPPQGPNAAPAIPPGIAAEELGGWKALVEDTKLNESVRRRQIHEMLAKEGLVKPTKVLKPIYKDVLLADLDDPYLGLGKLLFDGYPFAKDDVKP